IAGPVRDLNVMTRRGRFTATVTRHVLSERLSLTCAGETLILCAAGAACIEVAEESFALAPGDAWRAAVSDAAVACIAAPAAVVYHIAIKAPAAAG
ncbi:MAG: HutD family protein, partial [Pseudomonadota bacterium]|nr:HutD family protein [Pseudomonadota bacterium]